MLQLRHLAVLAHFGLSFLALVVLQLFKLVLHVIPLLRQQTWSSVKP